MSALVLVGNWIGGTSGMLLWGGIGVAFNFVAWWFSDKLALMANRAQPVTRAELPEVYEIVEELSAKAQSVIVIVLVLVFSGAVRSRKNKHDDEDDDEHVSDPYFALAFAGTTFFPFACTTFPAHSLGFRPFSVLTL